MIKAVIFDMDGLLIDSEPFWNTSSKGVLKRYGRELTQDEYEKALGRGIGVALNEWYHREPWKGATHAEVEKQITKNFLELVRRHGVLKPGVGAVLELLQAKNIPMAVASSSKYSVINAVIDKLEIRDYFDVLYSAEDETHGKPHPSVFISASEKLNVDKRQCLVFEDAPSGVLAAKAAGMKCIAVPERSVKFHPFIQTADMVIQSLQQFDEAMLDKVGSKQ